MWIYQNTEISSIEQLPDYEDLMGFVYVIKNKETGKFYIGKKNFYSNRKVKTPKKEQTLTKKGTVNKHSLTKRVIKESDWMKYWSSCDELKKDVKQYGKECFTREILALSCSVKMLGYLELKYQIEYNVLDGNSYNSNILGRYYPRDMQYCRMPDPETAD